MKKLVLGLVLCALASIASAQKIDVPIVFLERQTPPAATLSNLDPVPDDLALSGARLGVADNQTTGKFLGHNYTLEEVSIAPEDDVLPAAKQALSLSRFLLLKAPASDINAIADLPEAEGAIIFNVAAPDVSLRQAECRGNVLHTLPSRAMTSDALAQFSVKKKWTDWAMIVGPLDADTALADALSNSAAKFGIDIVGQKAWAFDADMRRNAAQEVPLFTQDFEDHDLMVVADELNDFARYVQYNTWVPRPLAGSWGASPAAWHASVEQHGAVQLQNRFKEASGRTMQSEDYAAMLAVRAIGEAVTRTNSDAPQTLFDFMLSDQFELAAFKGRPLSFRDWNGQMRQPIPIAHPGAVVALAPLDGFLHQVNELDTLGVDQPETTCNAFSKE